MAKQQSWKQQMYQSIANSQVQQVMQQQREQGIAQLQAEFDAWQKQQNDIAQLQADYDSWYAQNNPQPVQSAPVQTVKAAPKQEAIPSLVDFFKPTTASGKDVNKIAAISQAEEREKIQEQKAKRKEAINNTLNMLGTDDFKDMSKKGKTQRVIEQRKAENEAIEKQIAGLDTYNTDNLPQLTDDQKALEEQILNADRYVENAPKERWNNRFLTKQEKASAINNTTQADVDRWLSPETKLTQKEKGIARAYAAAELAKIPTNASTHQPNVQTEEEKQHYRDMVEIMNKTNPVSSVMSAYTELPLNLVDMVGDAGRSLGNQIGGLGSAITDKLGITEGATQRHNERMTAANEAADLKEANQRQSIANAQTQYPFAYGAGKIAGQVTAYALTNPVFDGIAEGAGVTSQLAKFFVNQGAQNAQDLALDTAPLVKQLMSDGSMSEEDKREVFNNVVLNALGNAGIGVLQEIPNIAKYAGGKIDARRAADEAFRQNVREGADKLARLAGTEDVDNVVRNTTRQYEEAAQNIENISKQMPEIPENVPNAVNNIPENVPENVPVRPGTAAPVSPAIENEAEAMAKAMDAEENAVIGVEDSTKVQPEYIIDSYTNKNRDGSKYTKYFAREKHSGMRVNPLVSSDTPEDAIRVANNTFNYMMETNPTFSKAVNEAWEKNGIIGATEAAKAIEQPKPKVVEPETPKLLSDDVEAQLAYDFENIGDSYYGNRAAIKQSLENKDFSIPNTAINDVPGKNGKMQYEIVDLDNNRKIKTYASRKAAEKAQAEYAVGNVLKEKAIKAFDDLDGAIYRYEQAAYNSADVEEVNTAKKAVEAARKRYERAMKEYDPSYYDAVASKDFGDRIARPYYTRNPAAENPVDDALIDDMVSDWVQTDVNNPNRFVRDAQPDSANVYRGVNNVPGAEPLQTFGDGNAPKDQWKTSKFRTNTAEKLGWGDNMPEKNYAYRVHTEAEQNAESIDRYAGLNRANELLNKNYDDFDEVDIKAAFNEMKALQDAGDTKSLRMADRIGQKTAAVQRQGARIVQASAEYTRDTFGGALSDAHKAQDDLVLDPWRSKNKKAREGNSRIAKALADMGHKADAKIKPELTHDQIKNGVIAELNREVGSVEKYFNDNDIEFLTRLAEDKSVPVWQITSEIEHKLNTGSWYTLDESVDIPKPTNRKLQNALDSLVTETVRAESQKPSLAQIVEEVRNTLGKESAEFEGLFTEDDINYLANLINEGATKEELTEALDLKLATGNFGISDATLQEVNNIFKQISNYDPNSKQFVEGQAEAYRLLANEILPNATLKEKFEAWRYIAMLGNPKTMLRNFIGNKTFNVVTGISNNVAAIAEAGIDRAAKALGGEGIQRTKAVLNPSTDRNLIKACAEDADASRYRQIIGSKYEKMSKDTLRRSKSVFNSKIAQLYEKVTDAGISDYSAVKEKYSTSLAGYMKANGMNTDIFKAEEELRNLRNLSETRLLSDAEKARVATLSNQVQELEKARDYALKQAEYATFHEDNKIANVLSKWSRTSKEEGTGIGHILLEGMVPFKKTPANVLRSGVEYSPLGAIDSIRKTGKLIYENTGKRAGNLADVYKNKAGKEVARTFASDVIDSWSKTLTGTGLTALGFFLYNKGILHSSDPDTKYQDELEGHQNYAIEINGKSYTIDWAAPTIMPLMVGAEIAKLWDSTGKGDEDFYNNIDGYLDAANRISDPLIETSMLQGVRDTLETAATYAQNTDERKNILPLLIYNTATGYATQGIPTLGGQIARTIDPTRRSTYTDKKGVPGVLDKQLKKQMNKIPGVSMLNQPYVDTYGREQQNSPFNNPVGNLAYQMVSPGYLSNVNETDADIMSREAYEVSKNANTLPKWQSKFTDAEGNRVSPEDYTTASKAYGQANYEIREAFANDEWFNSLDDTQKEEIVKGINTIAEHVGNAAIDPEYSKDAKAYNAYKDGGVEGLKEYWKEQVGKNKAKESGLSSTSNASKAIQEDMANGNEEAAQQKIDAAVSLQNLGLSKPGPTYTYYNAQTVIPGLTTEDFAKTYKTIDSDGNQGIKQDEVIAYLNSKKITSESEANKIWSAYGSSEWKSIPKLENGKWVKKKK